MIIFGGVTKIDSLRTDSVYAMWVRVTSLKEICWQAVTNLLRNRNALSKSMLQSLGVPNILAQRVL